MLETHEALKKRLGLDEKTPNREVDAAAAILGPIRFYKPGDAEIIRLKQADILDVVLNPTWTDVIRARAEYGRTLLAHELGLDQHTSWKIISETVLKKGQTSWSQDKLARE